MPEEEERSEAKIETIFVERKADQEDDEDREYKDRMVIRSFSPMIMLIPLFVLSFVCFLTQLLLNNRRIVDDATLLEITTNPRSYMNVLGLIFIAFFVLNILLIAFDFNRASTIILLVSIIAVIAILLLVNAYTGFFQMIIENFPTLKFHMSTQMYFSLFILFFFILLFTWIKTLFNYYVIEGNELIHHKGIGGGAERYPATNMGVVKEYPDLLETLFFRSGTLILTPPKSERAIVLRNVIGISKKVREMNEILARLKVDID